MNNKILYIGGFELPDKNAAAHRVIGVSNILKSLGYDVILLGTTKDKHTKEVKFTNESFRYYENCYPSNLFKWIKYLYGNNRVLRMIKEEKPSIVILYNYPSLAMFRILKYCKNNNIKVIADTTEWYDGLGGFIKKNIKKLDVFVRMNILNLKCDGQIVISRFLYDHYKVKQKEIVEIPPLFDTENIKYNNDLSSYNCLVDYINLIYSGSPGGGNKDRLDLIIRSVEKFPLIKLKIIGVSEMQYNSIFKDLNKYENVEFLGRVEHNEALELIKKSDFTIFLREKNLPNTAGFPTKFAETISIGTPVITNSSSNLKEYFQYGIGFEIEDISAEAIEKTLNTITELSKKDIINIKSNCLDQKLFDYRNYTISMREFLKSIK